MSDADDEQPGRQMRARGRRAAPKSTLAAAFEPVTPFVAASAAWLSAHRLAALVTAAGLATAAVLGGGVALLQSVGGTAGDGDASSVLDDPRPTSSVPQGPSPFGPILPTATPPSTEPPSTEESSPPPAPDEVVEPSPDDTTVVEPTTDPPSNGDRPGQGKGSKKPKG